MATQQPAVVLADYPDKQHPSLSLGGWADPEEVVAYGQLLSVKVAPEMS